MPLIQRPRKKARAERERSRGIVIKEPREQIQQPPSPRIQTPTEVPVVGIAQTTSPLVGDLAEKETVAVPQENMAEGFVAAEIEARTPESNIDADNMSAKESTDSAMDDNELSKLKEVNPSAALKLMLSLSSSSSNMVTSGSTSSLHSVNQESTTDLISQLKAKVLEGDIALRIRQNQSECFEVKALLNKLYKSKPNSTLLSFLLEFGPFFEQFCINVANHSHTLKQKEKMVQLCEQETNALQASQEKINAIEAEDTQIKANIADLDSRIQNYKEQIAILQTKLASAENWRQREEEKLKEPLESRTKAEAVEAIKHLDNVTQHQSTIVTLDEDLSYLEDAITLSSNIFDRLKISLSKL